MQRFGVRIFYSLFNLYILLLSVIHTSYYCTNRQSYSSKAFDLLSSTDHKQHIEHSKPYKLKASDFFFFLVHHFYKKSTWKMWFRCCCCSFFVTNSSIRCLPSLCGISFFVMIFSFVYVLFVFIVFIVSARCFIYSLIYYSVVRTF